MKKNPQNGRKSIRVTAQIGQANEQAIIKKKKEKQLLLACGAGQMENPSFDFLPYSTEKGKKSKKDIQLKKKLTRKNDKELYQKKNKDESSIHEQWKTFETDVLQKVQEIEVSMN